MKGSAKGGGHPSLFLVVVQRGRGEELRKERKNAQGEKDFGESNVAKF